MEDKQKVLLLCGKKQSGKNSASNFIHGYLMAKAGVISAYGFDEDGKLLVPTESGEVGILDIERKDPAFLEFAISSIWFCVKNYSFADNLKQTVMAVYGLTREQCYGTNAQKDAPTHIQWEGFFKILPTKVVNQLKKDGIKAEDYMSTRKILQYFGTNICRAIWDDCWSSSCINQIVQEDVPLAIVSDCRFRNEIEYSKKIADEKNIDLRSIRFTRKLEDEEVHESENDLDEYEGFDKVIDNANLSLYEKNLLILEAIKEWGWLEC